MLLLVACRDSEPPAPTPRPDAGAASTFESQELGIRFPIARGWRGGPPPSVDPDDVGIEVHHRLFRAGLSPVEPRIVVTREPTTLDDPELAGRRVENVLVQSLEAADARISRRTRRGRTDGMQEVSVRYRPPGDGRAPEIEQRSVVALRPMLGSDPGSLAIVTVTATYLAQHEARVGAEVAAMLDGLRLVVSKRDRSSDTEPPQRGGPR